ncbi:hypothetical protein PVAND_015199 [Polypedilum vanderplanki]|uniref:Peptidase C1A papain C-terminal domain-containing protein n=1 Tax=Polypedilum vanderplanki TaxID=319348 RepID=A0A9J6BCC6_POLVA|nr:hypothetical protein PVAND_015199 [Polypedilum vanderplanki]
MKVFLVILFLATLAEISTGQKSKDEIFNEYAKKFKIHFRRNSNLTEPKERISRKFHEFEEQEKKFQKGEEDFTRTFYEFSHLSDPEFAEYHLGALEPEVNETIFIDEKEEENRLKNQGNCGSCYVFAAINVIRSQLALKYGTTAYDLSEQDGMECTRGCTGGWDYSVYRDYSQKFNGVAAYNYGNIHTYTGVNSGCKASSRPRVPNTKVITYGNVANNEKTIRTYLYNYGPLYARFDVYSNFYEYSNGIYSRASGNRLGGHAVLLVGYGEQNGVKYWILKNSWDSWWGEKGYFRMIRGNNLCGIEAGVSAITSI